MKTGKPDNKKAVYFYIACSSLMLLWYKKIVSPLNTIDRVIFIMAVGTGILLAALVSDGIIKTGWSKRVMMIGCGITACICTPLLLLSGTVSFAGLILCGMFGGALFIMLQSEGVRNFSFEIRCLSFGGIFAAAGLVNTLTDLSELPISYLPEPPESIIMAILVSSVSLLIFIVMSKKITLYTHDAKKKNKFGSVALIAAAVSCVAYLVFSVKDSTAYPEALDSVSPTGWIRLIEVPMFIGIGWLCDKIGRHVMLMASLCLALLGSAGILFTQPTGIRILLESCSFMSMIAFSISICIILYDLSHYLKYPTIIISMGFAPLMVSQLFSLPLSGMSGLEPSVLFIIAFIPGLCLIPATNLLLGKIRNVYADEDTGHATSVDVTRFGLTGREQEVLNHLLWGKSTSDIASLMFITQKSVRNYISRLLEKTDTKSRVELIALFNNKKG